MLLLLLLLLPCIACIVTFSVYIRDTSYSLYTGHASTASSFRAPALPRSRRSAVGLSQYADPAINRCLVARMTSALIRNNVPPLHVTPSSVPHAGARGGASYKMLGRAKSQKRASCLWLLAGNERLHQPFQPFHTQNPKWPNSTDLDFGDPRGAARSSRNLLSLEFMPS